ncbi:MAG: hydroxyacid dehydrogenase [Phycisphaerae bacterium]|nr:hydroxyacid dehydrogenase [Phycisphaerae bacterium]
MYNVFYAAARQYRSKIFHEADAARIAAVCNVIDAPTPDEADAKFLKAHIGQADIVITSWGTANLDANVMTTAGKLKLVTHAAGSVKPVVSDALWAKGVRVTSSAAAISFGVAEFTLGLILLAPKRVFQAGVAIRDGQWREGVSFCRGPQEIYRETIGVIGASFVGKEVIRLLKNFTCDVILYDPYCSKEQAEELGVQKVETLEELFERSLVVSLHAPSTAETARMIRGRHFQLLRDGGVFINTARAAIVHEEEMIEELRKGRFLACIDVTDPTEPPTLDNPLRSLPNVWLTPHEAGILNQNYRRIGTFVADEIEAFTAGENLHYPVTKEMLSRIG